MDENQVGVAHLGIGDRLASTGGIDLDLVTVLLFKDRKQEAQQAGVFDRGGSGEADQLCLIGCLGD